MKISVVVNKTFEHSWPFAADHLCSMFEKQGEVELIRVQEDDLRPIGKILPHPAQIKRLVCLRTSVTLDCLKSLSNLEEAVFYPVLGGELKSYTDRTGVSVYRQNSEGFWGESVSECALALTLCGLRRIPQLHHEIQTSQEAWSYRYRTGPDGYIKAGQFCDDTRFTNGTAEGKKVRIVGAGNIGSRYASYMNMLGADVAAWDPFAADPCFHRAGARKIYHLEELVKDAEIFAPMLPLNDSTRGIVKAEHIYALPKGCLIVLITRAKICDVDAIRQRVLADEAALAADVHDIEPLPLDDPLIGRHNVVHTPHIAGRTKDANVQWARMLFDQFLPAD